MWVLANQIEPGGRLYWSVRRGWTYLELATTYAEQGRETYTVPHAGTEPVWLEVTRNSFGHLIVLDGREVARLEWDRAQAIKIRRVAETRLYTDVDPELKPKGPPRGEPDYILNVYGDLGPEALPGWPRKPSIAEHCAEGRPVPYRYLIYLKRAA